MRWEDESYFRFYIRDTGSWLALSWQARGLFGLICRKADRAGVLELGKAGKAGLPYLIGGRVDHPQEMVRYLDELLDDGCVTARGDELFIPNFTPAQTARTSDRQRQVESRERKRASLKPTKTQDLAVTDDKSVSHAVTRVTDCHSSRTEQGLAGLGKTPTGKTEPSQEETWTQFEVGLRDGCDWLGRVVLEPGKRAELEGQIARIGLEVAIEHCVAEAVRYRNANGKLPHPAYFLPMLLKVQTQRVDPKRAAESAKVYVRDLSPEEKRHRLEEISQVSTQNGLTWVEAEARVDAKRGVG